MTPTDLANRYGQLRQRTDMHLPGVCRDVSVPLPANLSDELAFYRLVNWAYILLTEASRRPIDFLIALPPLKTSPELRKDVGRLRTFVAHNLDVESPRNYQTRSFVHGWFREACGVGTPMTAAHYGDCCSFLAGKVDDLLRGAIAACDALDHPDEGALLVESLKSRVELEWEAHRFDPIVAEAAEAIGNPNLDLVGIRQRHLEGWRRTFAIADEDQRETALRLKIEATLVAEFADTLPLSAAEISRKFALAGPSVVSAALVLLRESRRFASHSVVDILTELDRDVFDG